MDIYFTETESRKAIQDIVEDVVFFDVEETVATVDVAPPVVQAPPTNAFERRR
jgi:hypothetical protein